MLSTTIKRKMATALSAATIATIASAPAASAMPADHVGASGPGEAQVVAPPARSAPEATPDAGFDLTSAAIGAASGGGLLIVVLAAGGMAWRRPMTRRHGAAGV
jgi:hypothetical protein